MISEIKKSILLKIHKSLYVPGHFYSPIPNLKETKLDEKRLFSSRENINGLDLNIQGQLEFLHGVKPIINDAKFTRERIEGKRYFTRNDFFVESDALYYEAIIKSLKPKNVIEVGSGFSSAVLFDTIEKENLDFEEIHFIEPYPERLMSLFGNKEGQKYVLHNKRVQEIPLNLFASLKSGDILFIDSSHVAKVGSDVNFLIFEILPILQSGVLIHFHDILYPFEYPKDWIYEGRFWNEAYLLKSFLLFNPAFKVLLFNDYLVKLHAPFLSKIDSRLLSGGGSIWIQKL